MAAGGVDGELRGLTTYGGELLGREVEEPATGEFLELARESGVAALGGRRARTAA